MTLNLHKSWLKVTAIAIIAYALLFFLGSLPEANGPIQFVVDLSSWPLDNLQNFDAPTTGFLSALLGDILFGWGILIWMLSTRIYELAPEQTRRIVLISALCWFVIDSLGSIFSGNPNNAIANVILLLILVGPLWVPIKKA